MRIVIDGRVVHWTGVGRYTRHLVDALAVIDEDNEYIILTLPDHDEAWVPSVANFTIEVADFPPYGLSEQSQFKSFLEGLKPDLVHFPHLNMPLGYRGLFVITIHDLTMLKLRSTWGGRPAGEALSALDHRVLPWALSSVVHRAGRVLTPSWYTAHAVATTFGITLDEVAVTYEVPEVFLGETAPVPGIAEGRPFVLHVGNFSPHRNLETLVTAMQSLVEVHPEVLLVLAGSPNYFQERLKRFVGSSGARGNVVLPGHVTDEQLSWLYQNATVFAFPPYIEGLGLPGLEAVARRLPVASSNVTRLPEDSTRLPEDYGGAATHFGPDDAEALLRVLVEVLEDPGRRRELVSADVARVRQFSWQRMAEQTLDCYRSVLADAD